MSKKPKLISENSKWYNWNLNSVSNTNKMKPIIGQKLSQGSGGDYLSNEIFYRVAKLRKDIKPSLPTGHFHISKIAHFTEPIDR